MLLATFIWLLGTGAVTTVAIIVFQILLSLVTVVVVAFQGGKIHHEHIHWDQASALVQLGLLDRIAQLDGVLPHDATPGPPLQPA